MKLNKPKFKDKGLKNLYYRKITPSGAQKKIVRILDRLGTATKPTDMAIPGLRFHRYKGKKGTYSVDVNGPWRITFKWDNGPIDINLVQPH